MLAAGAENAAVLGMRYDGGASVYAGGDWFGEAFDLGSSARYLHAVQARAAADLLDGDGDILFVDRSARIRTARRRIWSKRMVRPNHDHPLGFSRNSLTYGSLRHVIAQEDGLARA